MNSASVKPKITSITQTTTTMTTTTATLAPLMPKKKEAPLLLQSLVGIAAKQLTKTSDAAMDEKLKNMRVGQQLVTNGSGKNAQNIAQILKHSEKVGAKADRAKAAAEKAEEIDEDCDGAFGDANGGGGGGADDGDAGGVGDTKEENATLEALEADNRNDAEQAKLMLDDDDAGAPAPPSTKGQKSSKKKQPATAAAAAAAAAALKPTEAEPIDTDDDEKADESDGDDQKVDDDDDDDAVESRDLDDQADEDLLVVVEEEEAAVHARNSSTSKSVKSKSVVTPVRAAGKNTAASTPIATKQPSNGKHAALGVTNRSTKSTNDMSDFIVSDPDEIERENAKASATHDAAIARVGRAVDAHVEKKRRRMANGKSKFVDDECEVDGDDEDEDDDDDEENENDDDDEQDEEEVETTTTTTKQKAVGTSTATKSKRSTGKQSPLKAEIDTYFKEQLPAVPVPLLTSFVTVVIADMLLGRPSNVENNGSFMSLLKAATHQCIKLSTTQTLLHNTAEKVRSDVIMVVGLTSVLLNFIKRVNIKAYETMFDLLRDVNEIVLPKTKGEATLSEAPVLCAALNCNVHAYNTTLVQCKGFTPTGAVVDRSFRMCKSLVPVLQAILTLNKFADVVVEHVNKRKNGTRFKELLGTPGVTLETFTSELITEKVKESAIENTRKAFSRAYEVVKHVVGKFKKAHSDVVKFQNEKAQEEKLKNAIALNATHNDDDDDDDDDNDNAHAADSVDEDHMATDDADAPDDDA